MILEIFKVFFKINQSFCLKENFVKQIIDFRKHDQTMKRFCQAKDVFKYPKTNSNPRSVKAIKKANKDQMHGVILVRLYHKERC